MRRHTIEPRADWRSKVEETGLVYHSLDATYWDESVYYSFTAAEVDRLEAATARLQEMYLAAGQHVIDHDRFAEMHIPAAAVAMIKKAWYDEPPALYGRFDLAYDGKQIKLLEYNADTPTSLLESAVTQWFWLQERFPKADQWNSIHEKLIAKWKDLKDYVADPVYFGHADMVEDNFTIAYLRDTAEQAGLKTADILMSDIGFQGATGCFVDLADQPIRTLFKLYPWEMLFAESFGAHLPNTMAGSPTAPKNATMWIEPVWKMMFANKAMLAILWELYPGDELLLPAYLDGPREMLSYVRKPILSREGSNITLYRGGEVDAQTYGPYGGEGFVYQGYAPIACIDNKYPVLGSWMIDQDPAGMGIRESDTPITNNRSRFVPHLFE